MPHINFGSSFARAVHMICTHWMFVLTSFHLGMHIETIKIYIELNTKKKLESVVTKRIALFISIINIYGLKAFIDTQLWQYMFHLVEFMFYDFNRITLNVYLDYGSMMIMYSTFGYLISRLLKIITLKKSFVRKDFRENHIFDENQSIYPDQLVTKVSTR